MNEDELQQVFGNRIDLLDKDAVINCMDSVKKKLNIKNILIHTAKWSLIEGPDANKYGHALQLGIDLATTRYVFGDEYSKTEYLATRQYPKNSEGLRFSSEIMNMRKDMICLAAYKADVKKPTTVGLGDTFVGGFISAFYKE